MKKLKHLIPWGGGISYTLDFERWSRSRQDRFLERLPDFVAVARVVWFTGSDGHDYTYGSEWEWRADAPDGRMGDGYPCPTEAESEEAGAGAGE